MVTQLAEPPLDSAKTLICALNFLSRNLPLSQQLSDAVSSIAAHGEDGHEVAECGRGDAGDGDEAAAPLKEATETRRTDNCCVPSYEYLMLDFEDAVLKQQSSCVHGSRLIELKERRLQSQIQHRLTELEDLPTNRGEDLQSRCLLELYGLKLVELQNKVRAEVIYEYWLRLHCANPDKQLSDWGMMQLLRPLYGIGDAFAIETDDPLKKKRDAERLSRFEEEERNRVESRKRKLFADLLNAARELRLQVQAAQKRWK